ncbi:amidohydrolase/deacetylase family metallohydrolase [Candidatus Bathyarchaeota archaeon]|nr:MAG: amidohydrolase/deacetylase family metallohydrolase [Candidatus Bathyarchaeota archaeon]
MGIIYYPRNSLELLKLYDLLIKNGVVIDPSQGLHEKRDIAITKGKIESMEKDISSDKAREIIDASEHIVTPGLIDIHVHVYPGVSHYGIDADTHALAHGVTTVMDAGSSGADTFEGFRRYVVNVSDTRIVAFLNISTMGMISPRVGELEDLRFADVEKAVEVIERNRDIIQGVKVRMSRSIVGDNGIQPLLLAKRAAEAVKMPIMVHVGNTPMPLADILEEMRRGDILTHCFHGSENGILDNQGNILDAVSEAVKKGVNLDVGHGRGSFSFNVAEKALAQGVSPQTISSDLHHYNVFGPVYNLATTVSKFLYLGLSLNEALSKVTLTPAKLLGIDEELGNLRKGSIADVSIFKLKKGNFSFLDTVGKTVVGNRLLKPAAVVKGGKVYSGRLKVER